MKQDALTPEEFLSHLKGKKIKIIPNFELELENGEKIKVMADCSGCNNADTVLEATFALRKK